MSDSAPTRTQRFLGGLSVGYVSLLLNVLVGLWLTPFLIGTLGAHALGLWLVCLQVLGYLALADVGVLALVPRETAAATASDRSAHLQAVFHHLRTLTRWQVPVLGAAAAAVLLFLPGRWEELLLPLAFTLISYTVLFALRPYAGVLQGVQDLSFVGLWQLATWAVGTGVLVLAVLAGIGLWAPVIGWVVQQALFLVGCRLRVGRLRPDLVRGHVGPPLGAAAARGYLGRGLWVSLSQVSQVLTNGTDLLLIARVLDPAAAVVYSCTAKLTSVLVNPPQLLLHLAQPALSEIGASRDPQRFLAVFGAVAQAVLIASGGVALLVWCANDAFVSWWVGPTQFGGQGLTAMLALALVLRHVAVSLNYAAFCVGAERRLGVTVALEGAAAVGLGLLGVIWIGLPGAAIGSALAAALVNLPANGRTIARSLGVRAADVWRPYVAWARQVALCLGVLLALRYGLSAWTEHVGVRLALGGLTYGAAMLPLAFREPLAPYVPAVLAFVAQYLPRRATRVSVKVAPTASLTAIERDRVPGGRAPARAAARE